MRPAELDPSRVHEHHLRVLRTARYCTVGDARASTRELWILVHGYGQLARRFLRHFAALEDASRILLAPEALSRFYLESAPDGSHAEARVGATWMTREDRLAEIDDYVEYLDAVLAAALETINSAGANPPRVIVLGFSQGVATVSRWLALGRSQVAAAVFWAGAAANDLDLDGLRARLGDAPLLLVAGDRDPFIDPSTLTTQVSRLRRHGLEPRLVPFAGGHEIDAQALGEVVRALREAPPSPEPPIA